MNSTCPLSLVSPANAVASPCATPCGDTLVCHCFQVSESTIRETIDQGGARSAEEISACTGAGKGCGACQCRLNRMLMGLPAKCSGRFDMCGDCGCINAACQCESAA